MGAVQQTQLRRLSAAMLALFALLAALALAAPHTTAQPTEKRLALIIANDAYVSAGLGALPGVKTDIDVMQPALRTAGFEVSIARNLRDKAALQNAVSDFAVKLSNAGPNTVAFIYYSGHGVSDARRGQNFLIPTAAELRTLADLPLQALPLNDLLDAVEATGVKMAMVVADACRDTPVALSRGTKGFVAERARSDMLVAFATSPGETATDDNVYARMLAAELVRPGASSRTLFTDTQTAVARATQRRQIPEFRSLLIEHVTFVPAAAIASAPAPVSTTQPAAATLSTAASLATNAGTPTLRVVEEHTLSGHSWTVKTAIFSPDAKYVLTASADKTARLWDVGAGKLIRVLDGHADQLTDAAFSPSGKLIVTTSEDTTGIIWDAETGRSLHTLANHSGKVRRVVFSPNGRQVVTISGSPDHTARVWDAQTGQLLHTLAGHSDYIKDVAFSPIGNYIATASFDKSARVWSVVTGQIVQTLSDIPDIVYTVDFSPDGERLLTASGDDAAYIWDIRTGQKIRQFRDTYFRINAANFLPGGRRIIATSSGRSYIWDAITGQVINKISGGYLNSTSTSRSPASISPSGEYVITTPGSIIRDGYNFAHLASVNTGENLFTLGGFPGWLAGVSFSPNGKRIVTWTGGSTAKIWRIEE